MRFTIAFFSSRSSVSIWYTQFPLTSLVVESKIRLQNLSYFLPHPLVDLQNTSSLRWVSVLTYNDFLPVSEVLICMYQSLRKILCRTSCHAWNFFICQLAPILKFSCLIFLDISLLHLGLFCQFQCFCYSESSGVFLLSLAWWLKCGGEGKGSTLRLNF